MHENDCTEMAGYSARHSIGKPHNAMNLLFVVAILFFEVTLFSGKTTDKKTTSR